MKSEVRELLTEELKDAYRPRNRRCAACRRRSGRRVPMPCGKAFSFTSIRHRCRSSASNKPMEKMSVRPGRKVCEAMRGLVEEAQHEIEEHDEKGPILDLVIVAGMQRIEHYEIAAYGTDVALAEALGEKEVVDLLAETLEEEKQTDLKLTEVTRTTIMPEALAGDEEGDGERGGRPGGRRKAA